MKEILLIVLGLLLVLSALWGGAWLEATFPIGSPYNFAAVMSATLVGIVGFGCVVVGCCLLSEK